MAYIQNPWGAWDIPGDQNMGLVCHANAQKGAAARRAKLAGNQVFMVFRNDFAVRIINAAREAGFEAPIRTPTVGFPTTVAAFTWVEDVLTGAKKKAPR